VKEGGEGISPPFRFQHQPERDFRVIARIVSEPLVRENQH
jgi:hypothetical protein